MDEVVNSCIPCFHIHAIARYKELSDKSLIWFEPINEEVSGWGKPYLEMADKSIILQGVTLLPVNGDSRPAFPYSASGWAWADRGSSKNNSQHLQSKRFMAITLASTVFLNTSLGQTSIHAAHPLQSSSAMVGNQDQPLECWTLGPDLFGMLSC